MNFLPNLPEPVKAAPPVSAGVAFLASVPLATWVQIATLVWTVFLIIDKMPVVYQRLVSLWDMITKRGKNE